MNRRTHRKSRNGCRECKRRHIKCDERRPACAHCAITNRACHYVSASTGAAPDDAAPEAEATVAAEDGSQHPEEASSPRSAATPTAADAPSRTQPRIISQPRTPRRRAGATPAATTPGSAPGAPVNMAHMEFLLHYKFSVSIPELDSDFDSVATTMVQKLALQFPWLLHALLAIASRHLAVVRPGRAGFYVAEAFQLQTQAINIFNSQHLRMDEHNCAAALLFSSIMGRHMLVDALAGLESDGAVLLDDYCHYVQIHRGLRAIASDSWQLLSNTEIWPLLLFAGLQSARVGRGAELRGLRDWVRASGLDPEPLANCLEAVDLLQVGLDEVADTKTHTRRYQMAFIWSICTKADFHELVSRRVPQALVILAHYTALLHHARCLWQIRDAGYRFLHTICSVLGPDYEQQLSWVRNVVFGSGNPGGNTTSNSTS
ncbi:hypothetical protein F4802DRAFT_50066 [Xylaria palmicola]|nr:hypothetical protein F4802DRAFT_50066 [Xylaria palmicola]